MADSRELGHCRSVCSDDMSPPHPHLVAAVVLKHTQDIAGAPTEAHVDFEAQAVGDDVEP